MMSARRSLLALCLVAVSLVFAAHVQAAGEFSGNYSLGAAAPAGDKVQLTISLTLVNNTASDISNATVALHDPRAARVTYGELNGLSLAAGSKTQVSGSFTVPQSLYDSWQKGSSPAMSVTFSGAKGKPVRMFIEF